MNKKLLHASIAAYVMMAIYTFGISWNRNNYQDGAYMSREEKSVHASITCAIFWPFYWSVQLARPTQSKNPTI